MRRALRPLLSIGLFGLVGTSLSGAGIALSETKSETVYNETKLIFDLVLRRAMDEPNEIVPEFSSRAVPAWARGANALEEFYPPRSKQIRSIMASYQRPWTYRVAANVVGRSFDAIHDREVVIEVVGAPTGVAWEGVQKNGLIKRRALVQP